MEFGTLSTLTVSLINKSRQKKALRRLEQSNEYKRNLRKLGPCTASALINCAGGDGNILISGNSTDCRRRLLEESIVQSCSSGLPVVILHEHDTLLEAELRQLCSNQAFRTVSAAEPFYDPIFSLDDSEAAMLISRADTDSGSIAQSSVYLRGMTRLIRKKGIQPYVRMLNTCPHSTIQNIIMNYQSRGLLSPDEADSIRADIASGEAARPRVECLLRNICVESDILCWKSNLSRSTSIERCITVGGVICIDISSTAKKAQLRLICAELQNCLSHGRRFRLAVSADSLADSNLLSLMIAGSSGLTWTISTSDVGKFSGNGDNSAASWLSMSHKAFIFNHPVHSAEQLSKFFGEYDRDDVTNVSGGGTGLGSFGLHCSDTRSFSISTKREQVIKPEKISALQSREFILLDNNAAGISAGYLV